MLNKFVVKITYGTGTAYFITDTPDIEKAIQQFKQEYSKAIPDTKCYGLPEIVSAEIHVLMYDLTEPRNPIK